MIPRPTIRGIAGLSVLVALSFWLHRDTGREDTATISGLDTRLNYALHEFNGRYFDEAGNLAGLIRAPLLTNDAQTGVGRVEHPEFEVINEGNQWTIRSESATLSPERDRVLFSGAVRLQRQGPETDPRVEVRANEVTFEVEPRIARSDQAVTILEGANVLNAEGFEVDMIKERFQLLSDVRGHYAVR